MISVEKVKLVLSSLSSTEVDDLEHYSPIIKNAVAVASKLVDEADHSDERVEFLAAAKANYDICLISSCDAVTSFSAGDVSITQGANGREGAKAILDDAMKNVADIISDNGFAFMGV